MLILDTDIVEMNRDIIELTLKTIYSKLVSTKWRQDPYKIRCLLTWGDQYSIWVTKASPKSCDMNLSKITQWKRIHKKMDKSITFSHFPCKYFSLCKLKQLDSPFNNQILQANNQRLISRYTVIRPTIHFYSNYDYGTYIAHYIYKHTK